MKLKQSLLLCMSTLLLLVVGCKKDDYPRSIAQENSSIPNSALVDVKSYVAGWTDSIEMNSFDWNSRILYEANGKVIGWGIPSISDENFLRRLLIVNDSSGYLGEIFLNEISFKENNGILLPVKLNRKDIKRGTYKIQNLSNSFERSDSLITIFSHPSQPATDCPECTLPDVIIYAKKRSTSDNMNISPGPGSGSYIQAPLLGLGDWTGTSTSSGSGGSVTNTYYVLVTPPESSNVDPILNLSSLNDSEVSGGNLYTPYYYPGQDKGMEWAWWRKLDRDMFESDAQAKSFEHLMISLYVSYYANFEKYSVEHRNFSLEQWEQYILQNRNSAIVFPIIPIIIKIIEQFGINAAADLVIQVFFRYLTEDITVQEAFARVDWYQVAISGFEGLFQWKSAGTRVIKAAATAIGDIIRNYIQDENYSMNDLILDFAIGFTGDLGGGYLAEMANKSSLTSIGKGLLKKFNFPYSQVCKWVGYGLNEVSETVNGITSTRRMVGWAEGKVVIIGRQMENRVKVFSAGKQGSVIFDKSNPIASPYFTAEVDADWKSLTDRFGSNIPYQIAKESKLYKANLAFIRDLKEQGYTFIDCGAGTTTSLSPFYDMEINEIFK